MRNSHFLAQAHLAIHPCNTILLLPDGRELRKSLKSPLEECKKKYDIPIDCDTLETRKTLHTVCVDEETKKHDDNKLLETSPPVHPHRNDEMEKNFPRVDRTLLAQLRSNFCPLLKDYLHRIGEAQANLCWNCGIEAEKTRHALQCICKIDSEMLWRDPETVQIVSAQENNNNT